MAVSANSYFSNSIVGVPEIGGDIDLYQTDLTPKYALGFGFTRGDGNKYRYCHFGAVSQRGAVVAVDVSESGATKIVNVGASAATNTRRAGETFKPNYAGARYMQLVITATADQFAGGYITVTTGSGSGYTYRIVGNTATSDNVPATGHIYLDLADPIQTPIGDDSDIIIAGSRYANLEPATTTDPAVAGVVVTGNSASSYGWVCTGGLIGALQDVSIGTVGKPVFLSSNTTGAIQCKQSATSSTSNELVLPLLGYMVEAGSSADYSLVCLTLE